jgi:hypothetical protein
MNPQWSDEVKERYTKDQAFYAECTARGIQIRLNTDTLNWEGHMIRKPVGITAPYRKDDDDDIQDYKKPWVGLTYEEIEEVERWVEFSGRISMGKLVTYISEKLRIKNT